MYFILFFKILLYIFIFFKKTDNVIHLNSEKEKIIFVFKINYFIFMRRFFLKKIYSSYFPHYNYNTKKKDKYSFYSFFLYDIYIKIYHQSYLSLHKLSHIYY